MCICVSCSEFDIGGGMTLSWNQVLIKTVFSRESKCVAVFFQAAIEAENVQLEFLIRVPATINYGSVVIIEHG